MADEANDQSQEFPEPTLPLMFADGIAGVAFSHYLVKFYYYRTDPSLQGTNNSNNQVLLQVVMPLGGFLQAYGTMERLVKQLVSQGVVTQETVDAVISERQGE